MQHGDRQIRVFVSSTFRDMQEDRDYLVKHIFPQLRKLCESRGVIWCEVDLRWGITDEEAAEGKVLPLCLEEIQRCRPYFIGLLGERYGWVPETISEELVSIEPWLSEHKTKSVTELEILHGVLNNPAMSNRAQFYFRYSGYLREVPEDQRTDFVETDPAKTEKLRKLKQRIRHSGLALRENYPDPETLGEWVLDDLTQLINQEFPPESTPDPLDRQAAEHETFARSRMVGKVGERQVGCYIARPDYFEQLNAHAMGNGPPLVVLGESGSGKSALLANWAEQYRQVHPNEFVLLHFIGATAYSADWAAMLRRILGELIRRFELELEIPDKLDELRAVFANALHMAAARGRMVLVIDALNQLEDREGALKLVWLPPLIPDNVRLLISTLPGPSQTELEKRNWPTLTVQPLEIEERKQLTVEFLRQYTKTLRDEQIAHIAGCDQTANPLYLRALLEELRVFGIFERLDEQIEHYLAATGVDDLYERILERWEQDYEQGRPGLVREAMSLLWASRRGLSEAELLELLGTEEQQPRRWFPLHLWWSREKPRRLPLPRARWSPLFLAAEQSLVSRAGRLGFFHDYLRQAVQNKYLITEAARNEAHLRLADYFEARETDVRRLEELPWQLAQGQSWRRLYGLLSNLPFFSAAWEADRFDVKACWSQVEANSRLRMTRAYRPVCDRPARYVSYVPVVAGLFRDAGHPTEALSLSEYLVKRFRRTGNRPQLAGSLERQAAILFARCDLDGAMELYKQQEQICRELDDKDGLQTALGGQGLIHDARGDLYGAMKLLKQQEQICRELGNRRELSISLGNQAGILFARDDLDGAMELLKQQEQICRELGKRDLLGASLGNQALIFQARGDLDGAMELLKQDEQICRELGDKDGLQASLGNQAGILFARSDLDGAMELYKKGEQVWRELGRVDYLALSLANQAVLLQKNARQAEAVARAQEAYRLVTEHGMTTLSQRIKPILDQLRNS